MKALVLALALGTALSTGALAADVYNKGGSIKDSPDFSETPRDDNHSGFYIKGDLGIGTINRDASVRVDRAIDLDTPVPDTNYDGVIDDTDRDAVAASLNAISVPHTFGENNNILIPLVGDLLRGTDGVDLDSFVFGGEVSYLFHRPRSRFGFEIGLGVTGYGDAESTHAYSGANGEFVGGTALADFNFGPGVDCSLIGTCAGDPSPFSQSGVIKFDRDFDVDLVGRVHFFVTDRFALNAGGGLSWAHGNISAVNTDDTGFVSGLDTSIDEDVSSFGYILTAGATWWVTDRLTIGAAYDYKAHNFDASASAADSLSLGGGSSLEGRSNHNVEIDDEVHTFKIKAGLKLN